MRIVLKIIAAPFVLALMLIVAVLSFLCCIAGAVCWLACTVFVLLAACAFFAGLHTGCIARLVLAFLVSPFGLPAIGLWLLDRLYGAKYALQDFMAVSYTHLDVYKRQVLWGCDHPICGSVSQGGDLQPAHHPPGGLEA